MSNPQTPPTPPKRRFYREETKRDWSTDAPGESLSFEQIRIGCLLRMADAMDAMAKNHADLIRENKQLNAILDASQEQFRQQEKAIASLKGQVTKLKNKLK
jgi:hypothetical protein